MPRHLSWLFGTGIVTLVILGPLLHQHARRETGRNIRAVKEAVLYRSGQLSLDRLKQLIHDYDIHTVVTLRDAMNPGDPPPALAEEQYCDEVGITYLRIKPHRWGAEHQSAALASVDKFLALVDNPANYPILIHCFAGVHRTGAYCAIYRMEYEGWSNAAAIAEMRACGYDALEEEEDLLSFLETYTPRRRAPLPAQ